jgi:hypothetical protein
MIDTSYYFTFSVECCRSEATVASGERSSINANLDLALFASPDFNAKYASSTMTNSL